MKNSKLYRKNRKKLKKVLKKYNFNYLLKKSIKLNIISQFFYKKKRNNHYK